MGRLAKIVDVEEFLTHFRLMLPFYTPCKRHKTRGFLTFSVSIESEHWPEIVNYFCNNLQKLFFSPVIR